MYITDNGPHRNSWPDGGMTPFRSEKNTNWEGAFRIPLIVRWPGQVKAGRSRHRHRAASRLAADVPRAWPAHPDVVEKLKKGYEAIGRTYKNHIDGISLARLPHRQRGRRARGSSSSISATMETFSPYATTTGRSSSWSNAAAERCRSGRSRSRRLRLPKIFNLRTDPYEFADVTSNSYYEWFLYHAYILYGAYAIADKFAATFKDFPPIQKPNSFTIDDALAKMSEASSGS